MLMILMIIAFVMRYYIDLLVAAKARMVCIGGFRPNTNHHLLCVQCVCVLFCLAVDSGLIDALLLPRTNTRENNLTLFIIFCRGNLLRAKLLTVIQCPGHDVKLQPHRVNTLLYRVWDLACWW